MQLDTIYIMMCLAKNVYNYLEKKISNQHHKHNEMFGNEERG